MLKEKFKNFFDGAIVISDPTLRDGNHAIGHQFALDFIVEYAKFAEEVGVDIIEVGHGCGAGASSLHFGKIPFSEGELYSSVRKVLKKTYLGVHIIPGIGKISDLDIAMKFGVDIYRVASHCTEANTTESYIRHLKSCKQVVFGVLMMTHMADKNLLAINGEDMLRYGADGIILMDSAGSQLPECVFEKIDFIKKKLGCEVGFHAHNNLGLAVSNSYSAINAGAKIVDATLMGFGAGAGNTPIETLAAILQLKNYKARINFNKLISMVDFYQNKVPISHPQLTTSTLLSGYYGIFSGLVKHIDKLCKEYNLEKQEIYQKISLEKLVAGQEDRIYTIAEEFISDKLEGEKNA